MQEEYPTVEYRVLSYLLSRPIRTRGATVRQISDALGIKVTGHNGVLEAVIGLEEAGFLKEKHGVFIPGQHAKEKLRSIRSPRWPSLDPDPAGSNTPP